MPRGTTFRTWDDYFIPGTSVLRNKFTAPGKPHGESDPDKLRQLEEAFAHTRLQELYENPIPGQFDYDHMKAIHAYVFHDVYEWAGQERVAPVGQFMTKDGHAYYAAGPDLTAAAEAQYAKLAGKGHLRGLPQAQFVYELAESWGELNVVHSFREGNTRAQFVFFSQLAEQAGYRIDAAQFAPGSPLRDEFVQARFHSQDAGRNDQLAAVLGKAITPLGHDAPASRTSDNGLADALRASFPMNAKRAVRSVPKLGANIVGRSSAQRSGGGRTDTERSGRD
jgi:cell filamentation protein